MYLLDIVASSFKKCVFSSIAHCKSGYSDFTAIFLIPFVFYLSNPCQKYSLKIFFSPFLRLCIIISYTKEAFWFHVNPFVCFCFSSLYWWGPNC